MIRIRLCIAGARRARVMLASVILLGLLFVRSSTPLEGFAGVQDGRRAAFTPTVDGRHFYLTNANHYTDQALTACDSGYHMASLWEILDVSNLIYDYDHPAAHTKADSGYGPPSYWHGWVRTGQNSSGSTTTGTGNCLNWSTRSGDSSGVSVRLSRSWETAPGDIFVWDANTFACSIPGPVWCVGDFYSAEVFLPVVLRGP